MFSIYNKSSASMAEVVGDSVDLIYTSPPYNIGTAYQENKDDTSVSSYFVTLKQIFSECYRILKGDGKLVIEVADTIRSQGAYIELAALIQAYCLDLGFVIEERHINFVHTDHGKELPEHGWSADYIADGGAHSNCHQILVFSKNKETTFKNSGKVLYINYVSTPEHPCPIPEAMQDFILTEYYKPGMTVADPFMGTAGLGKRVLHMNGSFIGYELDPTIYKTAEAVLNS